MAHYSCISTYFIAVMAQSVVTKYVRPFLSTTEPICRNQSCLGYPQQLDGEWLMIQNHVHVENGYFAASVKDDGVENPDDLEANTYSIIGLIDHSLFRFEDGHYKLRLHFIYNDATADILEWSQSSWISEVSSGDVNLSVHSQISNVDEDQTFYGLTGSAVTTPSYLDGSGEGQHVWCISHAVCVTAGHDIDGGIPAHNGRVAVSQSLHIRMPIYLQSNTTDPIVDPILNRCTFIFLWLFIVLVVCFCVFIVYACYHHDDG